MVKKLNPISAFVFKIWFAGAILFVGGIGAIFTLINRKYALCVTDIWSKTTLWGAKHIAGIEIELRGKENLPDGEFFIAGKHLSTLDTIAPFGFTKTPAFIFKNELFNVPIFGWYLKTAGMIGIDRDGGMAALKSMIAVAKERLAEGRPPLIYPEGTRQELDAPTDYKSGVAAIYGLLGVPCVPMALNTGVYWPAKGFPTHSGKVIFEFLPPIEIGLKRPEFMSRLENSIESKTKELIDEAKNS
jgi:1-acyl-sn-glycerol-3-phosphate acyltransferase